MSIVDTVSIVLHRFGLGMGATFLLPIIVPLLWPVASRAVKVGLYVVIVLGFTVVLTGMLSPGECETHSANPTELPTSLALALLTGPVIAAGLRRLVMARRSA